MIKFVVTLLSSLLIAGSLHAETVIASTPEAIAVEARLVALSAELRCLVCQNESLASSRAPLAEDLRREVREQIRAGQSDKDIIHYLTDRYGDFVTYRPPLKMRTILLWFTPPILLLIGLVVVLRRLRRRSAPPKADPAALEALRREFEGDAP